MRNDNLFDTPNARKTQAGRAQTTAPYSATLTQAADVLRAGTQAPDLTPTHRERLRGIAAFLDSLAKQ